MIASLDRARVCIVGLGLMGGSLGMALRARSVCRAVLGSDRNQAVCQQAVAVGAVDEATADAIAAVRQADIIVLAAPVRAIIRLIRDLGSHLPASALLMDIGSTKASIMRAAESLPPSVQVVGGHPMCGKERAGIAAADPNLYEDAVFCLTPLERTRPEALSLAGGLVRAIGARPLVIEPQRHDALVAAISHLPYLMAIALTTAAAETGEADPLAWQLAASGFRDTSRLAGSDVDMMLDILLTNRDQVARLARQAASNLSTLAAAIENNDGTALRAMLTAAQQTRQQVYHQ
jgi:prephenate dehydrogenase